MTLEREGKKPGLVLSVERALADRLVFQKIRGLFGGRQMERLSLVEKQGRPGRDEEIEKVRQGITSLEEVLRETVR